MDNRLATLRFLAGRLGAYLLTVGIAYVLATVTATQAVVGRLESMGVSVALSDRIAMSLQDILGMAGMFLPMVAFGLLIALLCAALLSRWLPRWRLPLYGLAGAAAVLFIHLLLQLTLGIAPVAIARTGPGLLVQAAAGGVAGLAYPGLARRFE